jgi:hypothetical protein
MFISRYAILELWYKSVHSLALRVNWFAGVGSLSLLGLESAQSGY